MMHDNRLSLCLTFFRFIYQSVNKRIKQEMLGLCRVALAVIVEYTYIYMLLYPICEVLRISFFNLTKRGDLSKIISNHTNNIFFF